MSEMTALELKELLRSMYGGENKRITDEGYDKSLAVKFIFGVIAAAMAL